MNVMDSCLLQGLKPENRLRSRSSLGCSRYSSALSISNSSRPPSQSSLVRHDKNPSKSFQEPMFLCKICLNDISVKEQIFLDKCTCSHFCKDCLISYISMEIYEGSYEISCPDADCEKQGILSIEEMEALVGKDLIADHLNFRLNTEVALDSRRVWCPQVDCHTICQILSSSDKIPVSCSTCKVEFCGLCSSYWHPNRSCRDVRKTHREGHLESLFWSHRESENIKSCPNCHVLIERNAGCAQMMCKRCKHVFCWNCQASLDGDFLLRHYDSGQCRGKLGHSRASILWHRTQVCAVFAGFGILLLFASPLLLLAAPCILCCRCKVCQKMSGSLIKDESPPSRLL